MNRRINAIGNLQHPLVKFGNDFCVGLPVYKAEPSTGFEYNYPIFEILN